MSARHDRQCTPGTLMHWPIYAWPMIYAWPILHLCMADTTARASYMIETDGGTWPRLWLPGSANCRNRAGGGHSLPNVRWKSPGGRSAERHPCEAVASSRGDRYARV